MRSRRARLASVLAGTACLLVPAPSLAKTGTLTGSLVKGKLPSAAAGRAAVRAVRVSDGRVAADAAVGRRGTWKLKLDPGWYVVVADVVRFGKDGVSAIAPVERVRSGRTTRERVSLERTRTPRRGARAAASSPAVAVQAFTATGPNPQLGAGLARMLVTELTNNASAPCDLTVVEWEHRADIQREIDLSNSQRADPRTRIPRGHLIDPAVFVEGSVETTADSTTWTIRLVDASTGAVLGGDQGSADGLDFFDAVPQVGNRLAEQLCNAVYHVSLQINAMILIAPYIGTGLMTAELDATPVGSPPTSWMVQGPVSFGGLTYTGVPGCTVTHDGHSGYLRVEVKPREDGMIDVTWGGETNALTTLLCPNAPPIPYGVPPIQPYQQTGPTTFTLPLAGGMQAVSGALGGGGGSWTNNGTITITRVPG